jgi:hypothetical protein
MQFYLNIDIIYICLVGLDPATVNVSIQPEQVRSKEVNVKKAKDNNIVRPANML